MSEVVWLCLPSTWFTRQASCRAGGKTKKPLRLAVDLLHPTSKVAGVEGAAGSPPKQGPNKMSASCIVLDEGRQTRHAEAALKPWLPTTLLLGLCFLLFFFRLGDRDLSCSHEARAGQNGQAILETGRWDLPRLLDGTVEMQKPPLYYWCVALLGWLNNGQVDALRARLPSALSALGCVLLLWCWALRRGRPIAGFAAAIILATSLHFTALARTGRIDMPLTFTVALTLVGLVERWLLVAYLAIAAGLLLKGPIALALPGCVWLLWQRGPRSAVRGLGLWWGAPLVLALVLPWYLWANYQTNGEFFRVFFWHHNIDRGFGGEDSLRVYPFWFYGPRILIDLLPWSILLPLGIWHAWKKDDADARFGAVWLAAMLVLLSLMRFKRADYLLPAYPGAAWMLGCWVERCLLARRSTYATFGFAGMAAAMLSAWLGYVTLVVPAVEQTRTHRRFAEEVRRQSAGRILFFQAEAHLVALHVGRPLVGLLEWENLDIWAGRPETTYIVMPADQWREWREHITQGELEAVVTTEQFAAAEKPFQWLAGWADDMFDTRERPLVLVRTLPNRPVGQVLLVPLLERKSTAAVVDLRSKTISAEPTPAGPCPTNPREERDCPPATSTYGRAGSNGSDGRHGAEAPGA
jgi:4-amino-4-deoxy-L-arabinose transferase-like glycosyltransferase